MAIAFDASTQGTAGGVSTGGTQSYSHTTSGSDRILYVHVYTGSSSDAVASVTYNSVAMTRVGFTSGSNYGGVYLYRLQNPTTGTNTVLITYGTSPSFGASVATSYTGASQIYNPDNSTTSSLTTSASTFSITMSTNQDNCWTLMAEADANGGQTGGTGTTIRQTDAFGLCIADSNGAITPAGSTTLTVNISGATDKRAGVMMSFAPKPGSSIAYDNSSAPGNGVSSASFTTSGNNRILLVAAYSINDTVSGVTYGGTAMTFVGKTTYPGAGRQGIALYYLLNPASGANTISVSGTVGGFLAASYNGVGGIFVSNTATDNNTATKSLTVAVTPPSTNNWIVTANGNEGAAPFTATNSAYIRQQGSNVAIIALDSNGTVAQASTTMGITVSGNGALGLVAETFEPSSTTVANTSSFLMFMNAV